MAENKTQPTAKSVPEFLEQIEDPNRKADCKTISALMEKLTNSPPKMWGDAIVGFGDYHYKYASGREGDWFLAGFSPRKQNLTIYVMGYLEFYPDHLERLGKFKNGKGCLYIKKLEDIDMDVFETLITTSIERLKSN
ncbi:MAG: DUF1801 domain-containing protein [Bacteroidales bacterium]|nr:DUF1801 domain-containing protein [Bacteroidales bacterium]